MDKAVKMGKTSATGSVHMFIGRIISTIVLGIGTIFVGMLIDQGEYGLYTIALVPVATFLLFQDLGIGSALIKYTARYRAEKKEDELRSIIISGLTFEILSGLFFTLLSLITANFVASSIFGNPESALLIALVSITILFTAIYDCSICIFVGFERMELSTITMIVSAVVQGLVSPFLVYLGFGALGVAIGFTAATITSGVVALMLLYFVIYRKLPLKIEEKRTFFKTLKPLLKYGIPLSLGTVIGGFMPQVSSFVMASVIDKSLIGNLAIAVNFTIFLTFFTTPINTVLFPAFSKLDPTKDRKLLKTIFASSIKYSSLFLVPGTMALMVLSAPLISAFYGAKWPFAPFFLAFVVTFNLFVLLGNLSYNRLLSATGETKLLMKLNILTLCIGVPMAFILIPLFGIVGLIMVNGAARIPGMIIGILWTWKRYGTKPDFRNSARIFLASSIAALIVYLLLNMFIEVPWVMLIGGAILFLIIYLITIPIVGALNKMDISNLRFMFSGLGLISKLLEIPITIIEKLLKIKEKIL